MTVGVVCGPAAARLEPTAPALVDRTMFRENGDLTAGTCFLVSLLRLFWSIGKVVELQRLFIQARPNRNLTQPPLFLDGSDRTFHPGP